MFPQDGGPAQVDTRGGYRQAAGRSVIGDLGQQEVLLAKTADRSVLGCMNDMAFRCEHAARRLAV